MELFGWIVVASASIYWLYKLFKYRSAATAKNLQADSEKTSPQPGETFAKKAENEDLPVKNKQFRPSKKVKSSGYSGKEKPFVKRKDLKFKTIEFSYVNTKNEKSKRVVDVNKKEVDYFSAYCHLRQENRSFRYDRIQGEVIVVDTGEIISPSDFAGHEVKVSVSNEITNFKDALKEINNFADKYGWEVIVTEAEKEIGIFRGVKNGKHSKTPEIYLHYFELNDKGVPRARPWCVRSNAIGEGSSYKSLQKAVEKFEEYAKKRSC